MSEAASIKVGVLGCGSIGRRHIANLLKLGATDLVAHDPSPEARARAARDLAIQVVETEQCFWSESPEAVVIAAPTGQHIALAMRAVEAGAHLFIEKPLSHELPGAQRFSKALARSRLVSLVGCNMRFHPGPARVQEILRSGDIGQPIFARIHAGSYLPQWRPSARYQESYSASLNEGGAILDCIHELDLSLWYFGPAELRGAAVLDASPIGLATDGLAEMILAHRSGVLSSVHVDFISRDYRRTCLVVGTEGTITWDFREARVDVRGPDGQVSSTTPAPNGYDLNEMYVAEMAHFLRAISGEEPSVNPVEKALQTLELALQCRAQRPLP